MHREYQICYEYRYGSSGTWHQYVGQPMRCSLAKAQESLRVSNAVLYDANLRIIEQQRDVPLLERRNFSIKRRWVHTTRWERVPASSSAPPLAPIPRDTRTDTHDG